MPQYDQGGPGKIKVNVPLDAAKQIHDALRQGLADAGSISDEQSAQGTITPTAGAPDTVAVEMDPGTAKSIADHLSGGLSGAAAIAFMDENRLSSDDE